VLLAETVKLLEEHPQHLDDERGLPHSLRPVGVGGEARDIGEEHRDVLQLVNELLLVLEVVVELAQRLL